jgi:hypothetical protein
MYATSFGNRAVSPAFQSERGEIEGNVSFLGENRSQEFWATNGSEHSARKYCGTIFVWMHFFLASRANTRILHNANSRQTRKKEREGRCVEDATIN